MRFRCADRSARPEQRAADPQLRRAFGNGEFEVRRHSHRQRVERKPFAASGIIQLAQEVKLSAHRAAVAGSFRNTHESAQREPRHPPYFARQPQRHRWNNPVLGGLAADVDLYAYVKRWQLSAARRRKALRDLLPIDRLDPIEALYRGPR